jgi:hypothetical protein
MLAVMVDEGLGRQEAAKRAGLADRSAREAFAKPAVKAEYARLLEVFRTSERSRNLHAGIKLRDEAKSERVRLEAAKWLHGEHLPGGATVNVGVGVLVQPGYVLDLREDEESLRRDREARLAHIRQTLDITPEKPGTP